MRNAQPSPLLIAHRGESYDAPENTLAAINLAWQRGARAVEIDGRLTRDGTLIVSHDPDSRRIGGPSRPIRQQTLAELRALDAGAWKNRRWTGERIPLMGEVLATVPRDGRVFVELKEGPDTVPPLADALAATKLDGRQVIVMSFLPETVQAAARAMSRCEICLLLRARDYLGRGKLAWAIELARKLGCQSLDVESHPRLGRTVVDAAHVAGLRIYVWTVNRVSTAQRLAAAGIDGITTDRCAWMTERLGAL
jgi:glycerophosphoryl diester phosphodiesterase